MTEEDAEDRNEWRWKISCGDPVTSSSSSSSVVAEDILVVSSHVALAREVCAFSAPLHVRVVHVT